MIDIGTETSPFWSTGPEAVPVYGRSLRKSRRGA